MIAQITSIKKGTSRYGGELYTVFMKGNNGESYYTYLCPRNFNFKRWKKVMKEGIILKGLKLLKGKNNLVNADSKFIEIKEEN